MADVVLSYTIPEAKVSEAVDAFCAAYPNPEGSGLTDGQWVKYRIRLWINEAVNTGRKILNRQNHPDPSSEDFAE